jgi:RNA polymerase sigma-70 factor, ECF subfamily
VSDRAEGNRDRGAEPSSISSTLLERVKSQQSEAWTRLAGLYGPVVYRWCRQSGVARDDAPDVVQEVFAAVALHIGGFRRDRPGDSFAAWLRTITRNKIRDFFRSRRGRPVALGGTDAQERFLQTPELEETTPSDNPREVNGLVMAAGLELVRAEFEDRTWDAFYRTAIQGQSPAGVAIELGMSLQAVYQAKSRVLRRLRQELEGLME